MAQAAQDGIQVSDPMIASDGRRFTLKGLRIRAEIEAIERALGYTGWNRKQAARLLSISYRSLLLKIQQHKIIPPHGNEATGCIEQHRSAKIARDISTQQRNRKPGGMIFE